MSSSTVSSIAGDSRQPSERRHVDHLTERLEHINEQLAKVRQERLQLSATKVRTSRSNNSSFRDLKIPLKRKRAIPRRSGIPSSSMDYLIAEVVYSPYMTKPGQPYSQEVYRVPEKLKALKQQRLDLKSLPKDAQPFDLDEVKGTFKEITNYNTSFVKVSSSLHYEHEPDSISVPIFPAPLHQLVQRCSEVCPKRQWRGWLKAGFDFPLCFAGAQKEGELTLLQ